jgi:nucleotide-binding universal stress UspA family protein
MKKILFPTDFSSISNNAFIYALKLADAIGAEITTLHVYNLPSAAYVDVSAYLEESHQISELNNLERYKEELAELRAIAEKNHLDHIQINNILNEGDLVAIISKLTKEKNIDFVVMGTKGATKIKDVFLGTMTIKVINETQSIVLAIPEDCQFVPVKKILFITQYKLDAVEPLKKINAFAQLFHSHIDCLNVKIPHTVYKDDFVVDFENIFKGEDITFHSILNQDIEGVILDFIDFNKVNLVAMHIHHKNLFERLFQNSLSKKLTYHVNIPILALH